MGEVRQDRLLFWDILKGIGIISIVFGHSQNLGILIRVVYYYHLAVFFFVSGYFYNEERYGDKPFDFFGRRLKNMWTPYVCYGVAFAVFHNFMVRRRMFEGSIYGIREFLTSVVQTFLMTCTESPAGAMWFVPVMLATGALFAFLIWLCRSFLPQKARLWAMAGLCAAAGAAGAAFFHKQLFFPHYLQIAVLMIPVYFTGYLLKKKRIAVQKYVKWYGALVCIALFWYYLMVKDYSIELAGNAIPPGAGFYVISAFGIYLCCFVADLLEKVPVVGKCMAYLGRYSFDIMALHFLVFKLIDGIYGRILQLPAENYAIFPHSYSQLHVVYLLAGVFLSLFLAVTARWVIREAGKRVRAWAGN